MRSVILVLVLVATARGTSVIEQTQVEPSKEAVTDSSNTVKDDTSQKVKIPVKIPGAQNDQAQNDQAEVAGVSQAKIAVVSVCTGEANQYCQLTKTNHLSYTTRHGYDYVGIFAEEGSNEYQSSKWLKFDAMLDAVKKYDVALWIDADAVFMNQDQTLENLMEVHMKDKDLLIQRDMSWDQGKVAFMLNTGVFAVKRSEWSIGFLQAIKDKGALPEKDSHGLQDQPRLCQELIERGEMDATPKQQQETHTHTSIVPWRVMNSFHKDGWLPDGAGYEPGDFIAHCISQFKAVKEKKEKIEELLGSNQNVLVSN